MSISLPIWGPPEFGNQGIGSTADEVEAIAALNRALGFKVSTVRKGWEFEESDGSPSPNKANRFGWFVVDWDADGYREYSNEALRKRLEEKRLHIPANTFDPSSIAGAMTPERKKSKKRLVSIASALSGTPDAKEALRIANEYDGSSPPDGRLKKLKKLAVANGVWEEGLGLE
ncbi:hypothetical protein [Rhizobium sp. BK602]|uniref:hypothetical protein n=1 Tax=Rhizobium sp. BK602 TaxID=2586986 RepID=UPI00160FC8D8|nr:hypothetical protein [Rhizobium sp. BK602]MBB3608690.1 hypothetical protein [Rhizobium sp. BK602]